MKLRGGKQPYCDRSMQLLCSLPVMRACRRSASYMSAQSSQCQRFSSLRPSWRSRRDCAVVEKVAQRADLDGEIDVLGNIAGRLDDSQRIELCTNHADNIAAAVMQRSSAIAGLNGCADLQKTRIVMQPRQGADDSGGHSEVGCEKTMQRITDCNHLVTRVTALARMVAMSFSLNFFVPSGAPGRWSRRPNRRAVSRGLTREIALNVADAVGDDVVIGDDMGIFADDKTAAGNLGQSF